MNSLPVETRGTTSEADTTGTPVLEKGSRWFATHKRMPSHADDLSPEEFLAAKNEWQVWVKEERRRKRDERKLASRPEPGPDGQQRSPSAESTEQQRQSLEETFSEEQAARLLGISRRMLSSRRYAGKIEALTDGWCIRYTAKQLADYQQTIRVKRGSKEKIDTKRLLRELHSRLLPKK